MNPQAAELARRREYLISRSAAERELLARNCRQLENSLRFIQTARGLIQLLVRPPTWLLGLTALFLGKRRNKLGLPLGLFWLILRRFQAWRSREGE